MDLPLLHGNKALSGLSVLYRFIQLNVKASVFKSNSLQNLSSLNFSSLLQQVEYLQMSYFYTF